MEPVAEVEYQGATCLLKAARKWRGKIEETLPTLASAKWFRMEVGNKMLLVSSSSQC